MQTFLPVPDIIESAKILDYRRLGKQRVEAFQILKALGDEWALDGKPVSKGWMNHPATKMWRNHTMALRHYMNVMIVEWIYRGYRNTMRIAPVWEPYDLPNWIGNEAFHASHRSNLLRKDPSYYGQFGWTEPFTLDYMWPAGK